MHWNRVRDFVKLAQISYTLTKCDSALPKILCGDMNSVVGSNVYEILTNSEFKVVKHPKTQKSKVHHYEEVVTRLKSEVAGKFVSAYADYANGKHPDFTVNSDHRDCIDYIFHTAQDF